MDLPKGKPADRAALALDAFLTLAVFAFFTWILRSHVPSNDPFFIWLWGAITASCLAALFWLALQMFRVVLRAQLEAKARAASISAPPERAE
jgi:heme exporter protein D